MNTIKKSISHPEKKKIKLYIIYNNIIQQQLISLSTSLNKELVFKAQVFSLNIFELN